MKEEWKHLVIDCKVHDWYSVSNYGKCASHIKFNFNTPRQGGCEKIIDHLQFKILKPIRKYQNPKRKDIVQCVTHSFAFPSDFFKDYNYAKLKGGADGNIIRNCKLHRLVMESFKPIDIFPPNRLKDCWNDIPEAAKKWIRETVFVNHIDHNPDNNHVDNLEWVTPRENSRAAVKMYGQMCNKEDVLLNNFKIKEETKSILEFFYVS
jgi:hypothetical protein